MTTNEKLEHARCLANATRYYLNSAYADLRDSDKSQAVMYAMIGHCDSLQWELGKLNTDSE